MAAIHISALLEPSRPCGLVKRNSTGSARAAFLAEQISTDRFSICLVDRSARKLDRFRPSQHLCWPGKLCPLHRPANNGVEMCSISGHEQLNLHCLSFFKSAQPSRDVESCRWTVHESVFERAGHAAPLVKNFPASGEIVRLLVEH
jgi:hypothetical protein